jgi:GMP synthase (glutamine-hydrolysing)
MEKLAVLDFGGQYAHLIANRVRKLGVYTEILAPTAPVSAFSEFSGIIYSGGPSSVYLADAPEYNPEILSLPIPKLGICYGHQLISRQLGGAVEPGKVKEYGVAELKVIDKSDPLLKNIPTSSPMWMSHGDMVSVIPKGFSATAITDDCASAAISSTKLKTYGIQFHPEVTHSKFGNQILSNFLDICGCKRNWSMKSYLEKISGEIRSKVQNRSVFLLVSGGVDSTVAFVLLNRILGKDRVLGLHVDNGMMRLNESRKVKQFLALEGLDNLEIANSAHVFLNNLKGIWAPEEKRKIIGDTFLEVKDHETERLGLDSEHWILAQGTIYPDTIESGGTKHADLIKTHHNRVDAIMELIEKGLIIEPLADLYKDEVRYLGEELGIPRELLWRHPFPGPGLGVRLLCSKPFAAEPPPAKSLQLIEYLKVNEIDGCILPIRSVGVQGDARTYAHPFLLRSQAKLQNWDLCEKHATSITNRIPEINRVVLEIGCLDDQAPVLISQFCEAEPLEFLREVDDICTQFLINNNLYNVIWQMPVVLLPLQIGYKPVVVIRPVDSSEAMTASFSRIDFNLLQQLWHQLKQAETGALYYDITHKPPGTIEWE